MRRFIGIASVAAALSMLACETSDAQQRQGRTTARYNDTTTRPVENRPPPGEYRPNDSSPMRGDESFPAEYPGTSTGSLGSSTSGSTLGQSSVGTGTGSSIDRQSSTQSSGALSGEGTIGSSTGETGVGTTNSDRLSSGGATPGSTRSGTTGTGSTGSTGSSDRYEDPAKHTEGSATSSTGTGTSTAPSASDRSDSTGNVGTGSKRMQGRTGSQERSVRPRSGVGAPPTSDPLGNTNSDSPDVSGTPPIPSEGQTYGNPYDLGAAKSPKSADAGTGGADGGTRFEGNLPSDRLNTY